MIAFYAEKKKITVTTFEEEYLNPAMQLNAKKCILFLLDWKDKNISIDDERFSSLSENEKILVSLLIKNQKMSVDELIRSSGLATKDVNSVLPLLEISGVRKKYAGNLYALSNY